MRPASRRGTCARPEPPLPHRPEEGPPVTDDQLLTAQTVIQRARQLGLDVDAIIAAEKATA